jgi:hypothetical protein
MNKQAIDEMLFVSQARSMMNESRLMLSYRGEMSPEIVMALLNLTENKLNQTDTDNSLKTKVFCVMVECLQNITQHSEKEQHKKASMFMIGQSDKGYQIYSGNVIKSAEVKELEEKILKINTLSGDELKEFYKYWMNTESSSQENGFGLGLIDIARKTGNPLEFDFNPIDNDHSFFSLKTLVDHKRTTHRK